MLLFLVLLVLILLAVWLAWYFIAHDHGEREPIGALWLAAGFGLAGGVVASVVETFLVPSKNLLPSAPLLIILGASLLIGAIEEIAKFVPLASFIYHKRYFNEHTDGIIYFALAGLGFGLPENILYSLQFGARAGLGRIILTPFFHAAITGMVGFYLAKEKVEHRPRQKSWLALGAAILLHGLYDFGLFSGHSIYVLLSIIITLSLSIGLFVLYVRATELDQAAGLSVAGYNNFCRACGRVNSYHQLYCTYCGKHA